MRIIKIDRSQISCAGCEILEGTEFFLTLYWGDYDFRCGFRWKHPDKRKWQVPLTGDGFIGDLGVPKRDIQSGLFYPMAQGSPILKCAPRHSSVPDFIRREFRVAVCWYPRDGKSRTKQLYTMELKLCGRTMYSWKKEAYRPVYIKPAPSTP